MHMETANAHHHILITSSLLHTLGPHEYHPLLPQPCHTVYGLNVIIDLIPVPLLFILAV